MQTEISTRLLPIVAILLICGHSLGFVAEWRVHRRNWATLREHGAEARRKRLMVMFYVVAVLSVPLLVGFALFADARPTQNELMAGLGVIALSQALRRWAISSLGTFWTMALIELEGLRPLNAGPYRWLKSPEYISRLTELIGVVLATGVLLPGLSLLCALSALALMARSSEDALLYEANRVISRGPHNP